MYIIAERLRRPMRRQYGGKWISMLGIPPFTFIFMPLMVVTMFIHRAQVKRRKRLVGYSESFIQEKSQIDKPAKVVSAIKLLKIALVISILNAIIGLIVSSYLFNNKEILIGFLLINILTFGIIILFIYWLNNGKNWARVIFLIVEIIGGLFFIFNIPGLFKLNDITALISIVVTVIQFIALFKLYSKESNAWFKRTNYRVIKSEKADEKFIGSWF